MFYCERCGDADCCERLDLQTEPVLCDACYKKETTERLIDVFMHIGDHISNRDEYGICFDTTLAKAIEDVIVMLKSQDGNDVTIQKWIPVTERFPDLELEEVKTDDNDLFPCLVVRKHPRAKNGRYIAKMWYDGYGFLDGNSVDVTDEITHWMPLPEMPKTNRGAD